MSQKFQIDTGLLTSQAALVEVLCMERMKQICILYVSPDFLILDEFRVSKMLLCMFYIHTGTHMYILAWIELEQVNYYLFNATDLNYVQACINKIPNFWVWQKKDLYGSIYCRYCFKYMQNCFVVLIFIFHSYCSLNVTSS